MADITTEDPPIPAKVHPEKTSGICLVPSKTWFFKRNMSGQVTCLRPKWCDWLNLVLTLINAMGSRHGTRYYSLLFRNMFSTFHSKCMFAIGLSLQLHLWEPHYLLSEHSLATLPLYKAWRQNIPSKMYAFCPSIAGGYLLNISSWNVKKIANFKKQTSYIRRSHLLLAATNGFSLFPISAWLYALYMRVNGSHLRSKTFNFVAISSPFSLQNAKMSLVFYLSPPSQKHHLISTAV